MICTRREYEAGNRMDRKNGRGRAALSALALSPLLAGFVIAASPSPSPAQTPPPPPPGAPARDKTKGHREAKEKEAAAPSATKRLQARVQPDATGMHLAPKPAAAFAYQRRGDALFKQGSRGDAARHYALAAAQNPRDPLLRLSLGVTLADQGMLREAIPQFQKALELAEDDVIASFLLQNALAETKAGADAQNLYLDTMRRFARKGRPGLDASTSITRLSAALRQSPDSPVYRLLLGDAYQLGEQWARADDEYRRAVALAPTWPRPLVNLGLSRLAQGRVDEAVRSFEAALRLDPRNVQAQLGKGDAELRAGRNVAAISTYKKVPRSRGASPGLQVQAMTGMSQALANTGKVESALNTLNAARRIDPKDPAPSAYIGQIQVQNGNFAAGASAYETALRLTREGGLFAQRPILYRALAEAHLFARQPEKAKAALNLALAEEPQNAPQWYVLLARAYADMGQKEASAAALRMALDTEPGPYPLDTLTAISARGLLDEFAAQYKRDLITAESGVSGGVSPGGGVSVRMVGPQGRGAAKKVPALVALAHIARYRNDSLEEVRLRRQLTELRRNAYDWYLLAETYDLRLIQPVNARDAYGQALQIGGLNDAAAAFARLRLEKLTAPAYNPR